MWRACLPCPRCHAHLISPAQLSCSALLPCLPACRSCSLHMPSPVAPHALRTSPLLLPPPTLYPPTAAALRRACNTSLCLAGPAGREPSNASSAVSAVHEKWWWWGQIVVRRWPAAACRRRRGGAGTGVKQWWSPVHAGRGAGLRQTAGCGAGGRSSGAVITAGRSLQEGHQTRGATGCRPQSQTGLPAGRPGRPGTGAPPGRCCRHACLQRTGLF